MITGLLGLSLILTSLFPTEMASAKEDNLTQEEISIRLLEIHDEYDVGDLLNEEDAAFVKKYTSKPSIQQQITGNIGIQAVNKTGYTFYGIGQNSSGTVKAATLGDYTLHEGI